MKRVISFILVVGFVFALTACKTKEDNKAAEVWNNAEALLAGASGADFDVSYDTSVTVNGETTAVKEHSNIKYCADTDGKYVYSYSSSGDTGDIQMYYKNGYIYENSAYGSYKAPAGEQWMEDFISQSVPGLGDVTPEDFGSVVLEESQGGYRITAGDANEKVFEILGSSFSEQNMELISGGAVIEIEMTIGSDGQYKSVTISFSGSASDNGGTMEFSMKSEKTFNSIGGDIDIELPENAEGYTEVSDIRIPEIYTAAYTNFAYETDHQVNVKFNLTLSSENGDTDCGYDIGIASRRDENGELEAYVSTELSSLGETFSFSERYSGGRYTLKNASGEESSEEMDYTDMLDYIYSYMGWYSDSLPYMTNVTMEETDGQYIITYDYLENYTDADIDALLSYTYAQFEGLIYNCLDWSYDHSTGRIVIDADTLNLISHSVSHDAAYTFQEDTWHIAVEGAIVVEARGESVVIPEG